MLLYRRFDLHRYTCICMTSYFWLLPENVLKIIPADDENSIPLDLAWSWVATDTVIISIKHFSVLPFTPSRLLSFIVPEITLQSSNLDQFLYSIESNAYDYIDLNLDYSKQRQSMAFLGSFRNYAPLILQTWFELQRS